MIIKKFIEFTNESYLEGSRQPIYHITRHLYDILKTDLLKCNKPARTSHGKDKSISLTRNIDFSDVPSNEIIELDVDKLINSGIKTYPVDEWAWKNGKRNLDTINLSRNLSKSGFDEFKKGNRGTKHNLDLPKEFKLETEFEERIYKDITNLGKYIISLNFRQEPSRGIYDTSGDFGVVKDYLQKYPHIKVYLMDKDNRRKRTDITYKFVETKDQVLSQF